MKMNIYPPLRATILLILMFFAPYAHASGGYDNGTPAGKGRLDLDFTLNPGDVIDDGQSYVVWGYGITDKLDFHGYFSHEASGTDQLYYGFSYNFLSNDILDLSTAFGLRHREGKTDVIFPQLLYTIKLPNDFDIIGSSVLVYRTDDRKTLGTTFDIALRIPVPKKYTPSYARSVKFAIGAFRGTANRWLPTYSVDFKF